MLKIRDAFYIVLFLLIVLALWTGLALLPGPEYSAAPDTAERGRRDLTALDLTDNVYGIGHAWDAWPDALLLPDELGDTGLAPVPYQDVDRSVTQYATYRMRVSLQPGITYGIAMRSADYAMRLFIDGAEAIAVGVPAETEENNVARVRDVVHYFVPQSGELELVVQSSNFVHNKDGASVPGITIGTAENISQYTRNESLIIGLTFGCLVLAGMYHLAIFLINRRQRASLVFFGLCVLMALVSDDFASLLFPSYSWQAANKAEYIIYTLAAVDLLLLANTLFPKTVHKPVIWGYAALSGVYIIVVLTTSSTFFTVFLTAFQAASVAVIVYGVLRLAWTLREGRLKNMLAFLGIALFCLCIIYDILHRNGIADFLDIKSGQVVNPTMGMILLVSCFIMVLAIDQAEINQLLEESRTTLANAEASYLALYEEKQIRENPSVRLSDFGLTKRETEVALLLLDGKSRDEIARLLSISMGTVNTHCTNIYRKAECGSVAELAGKFWSDAVAAGK